MRYTHNKYNTKEAMIKYLLAGLLVLAPMSAHAQEFNVEREVQKTAVVYCETFDKGDDAVDILSRADTYITTHVSDPETREWLQEMVIVSLMYTQIVCPEHKDLTQWIVNAMSPKQPQKEFPYSFRPSRQRLV